MAWCLVKYRIHLYGEVLSWVLEISLWRGA